MGAWLTVLFLRTHSHMSVTSCSCKGLACTVGQVVHCTIQTLPDVAWPTVAQWGASAYVCTAECISLCPSPHCFLVFSSSCHLSPIPGVELPRRNCELHTSPSALPVPGMLAGPGEGEPPSPGASAFIVPPDLVSALSIFPAPRAAPFPSPANTLETPFLQDSGSSSCCPLPGGVCPPTPAASTSPTGCRSPVPPTMECGRLGDTLSPCCI